jgi:hypothetical protein
MAIIPCPICKGRHAPNQPCPPPPTRLLDDVQLMNVPDPTWDVAGRLVNMTLVNLFGPAGRLKTSTAVDLGLSLTVGTPWLGAEILHKGPVVYGAFEGGAPLIRTKVEAWKHARNIPLDECLGFHVAPEPVDLMDLGHVLSFIRAIEKVEPRLVVLDTLARAMTGDENSTRDMGLVVNRCDLIRRKTGAMVMVIHHTGKDEKRGPRGSSALTGAFDTELFLNGSSDTYVLRCRKQRYGPVFDPVRLKPVPTADGRSVLVELVAGAVADKEQPSSDPGLEAAIVTFLRTQSGGVVGTFIAKQVQKQKDAVLKTLRSMERDGRVTSKKAGRSQFWRLA